MFNTLHTVAFMTMRVFGFLSLYRLSGNSLTATIGCLILFYVVYVPLLLLLAPLLGRLGTRRSMQIGEILFAFSLVPMLLMEHNIMFALPWVLLWSVARTFFNSSWQMQMGTLTNSQERGSQIGTNVALVIVAEGVAPLISGYLLSITGQLGIFVFGMVTLLVALVYLRKVENIIYYHSGRIFSWLRDVRFRQILGIVGVNDTQNNQSIFWEIFVLTALGYNFRQTGLFFTAVMLISAVLAFSLGKFWNHHNRRGFLHIQGIITFFTWIGRFLANGLNTIIISDTVYRMNRNLSEETIGILNYDIIAQEGQEVRLDEKIVARELWTNTVISFTLGIGLILALNFGLKAPLIFAATVSLLFIGL